MSSFTTSRRMRDRSLIAGRGETTKWENRGSETLYTAPPPQDRVKLFMSPLLKSENFLWPPPPPLNMAKTSNYCPPFRRGKTSIPPPPPLLFCRPPPLPIIGDQSLRPPSVVFLYRVHEVQMIGNIIRGIHYIYHE